MSAAHKLITDHLSTLALAVRHKSAAGRGSSKKVELYGIKKVRELILELAVRGKLVPQDPNDEPASVLLEKIAAEKKALIAEGKIKKQKPLPPIGENEKPFALPQGWEWARIGTIGYTQTGGTPKKANTHHYGSALPFIKPGDIGDGKIFSYKNDGLSSEGAASLGRYAPTDSILMVCIGSIGRCARVSKKVAFNQQINSVTPYRKMGAFVLTALMAPYFQRMACSSASSTTLSILNKGKWELLPIPIPPENEQHRIVAKVDELMGLCDQIEEQTHERLSAQSTLVKELLSTLTRSADAADLEHNWNRISQHFTALFTTEESIDELKKTILQLAVMGKLVPQDPNDEPASVLLEKIAAEKKALIAEGKIKKQKPLPPIGEDEKPFALPEGWEWARIASVTSFINGFAFKSSSFQQEGIGVVKIGDIGTCGRIKWRSSSMSRVSQSVVDDLDSNLIIKKDDLVIAMSGATTGKLGFNRDDEVYYLNQRVGKFSPHGINLEFLYLPLQTKVSENLKKSMGSAIPNLSTGQINMIVFPLPPMKEQHRIVVKVGELMALCDKINNHMQHQQKTHLHLIDAMVERALT